MWKICIELADHRNLMTEKNRKITRHVKGHIKQTLAEITNCIDDALHQPISSSMARRRLHSCGYARKKIWKQIVTNRVIRDFLCDQISVVCHFDANFPCFVDIFITSKICIRKIDLHLAYSQ